MNEALSGVETNEYGFATRDNSDDPVIVGGTIIEAENGNPDGEITVQCDNGVTYTETFGKYIMHRYADFSRRYGYRIDEDAVGNRVVAIDQFPISSYNTVLSVPLKTLGGDMLVTEEQFETALRED